jgi:neutral ceramidase
MSIGRRLTVTALVLLVTLAITGCPAAVISAINETEQSLSPGHPLSVDDFDVDKPLPRTSLIVGVKSVDITPPVGFPTGGHGPAGAVSRGQWLPLKARAFFFGAASGRNVVLITAELFALPGGLKMEVARRVNERLRDRHIALPPEAIVVAATHTHQGPGNFLTTKTQNQFGSTFSGFSRKLFDFLVEKISGVAVDAILDGLENPRAVEIDVHSRRISELVVRSRAPGPFSLNPNRDELLDLWNGADSLSCDRWDREPDGFWDRDGGCLRLRAVDRTLTVLELKRGGAPIGKLVFLGTHPSVLDAQTPFYSPDFTGYAMSVLERDGGVAGFFNGADGDVVARRTFRGLEDVRELGNRLVAEVDKTLQLRATKIINEVQEKVEIRVQAGQWAPSSWSELERTCQDPGDAGQRYQLAQAPVMGAPGMGGAEDDRTELYALGWQDGIIDRPRDDPRDPQLASRQGVKLPGLDSKAIRAIRLTSEFAPTESFPLDFPLSVISIGPLRLATVPLEMTSAQGRAVREALDAGTGLRAEVIGLANEYHGYCATEAEYSAQNYEGALTWWGRQEGPYVTCRFRQLVADGGAYPRPGHVRGKAYMPGPGPMADGSNVDGCDDPFGPSFAGSVLRPQEGIHLALARPRHELPDVRAPWFRWSESEPKTCTSLNVPGRSVSLFKEQRGDGWCLVGSDRDGTLLNIRLHKGVWSTLWVGAPLPPGRYQFQVRRTPLDAGPPTDTCSEAFDPGDSATGSRPEKEVGCPHVPRDAGGCPVAEEETLATVP